MKILVTGGAGFVGTHLCKQLLKLGHEIVVVDNLSTGRDITNTNLTEGLVFVNGTILNEVLINRIIRSVDYVIHLAASVGVANIMSSPLLGLETNVLGSEIILRASSKHSVPILITSSSEVYGKNTARTLSETSDRIIGVPQISRWSYSDSKAVEEAFAFAYFRERSLDVKIVRLFNTVGPGQRSEFGMVIPKLVQAALNEQDMIVHGNGKQKRSFMHVDDAVNGILKVLASSAASGQVFNLGNPRQVTIKKLAKNIKVKTNSKSKILFQDHRVIFGENFEDMSKRVPYISKAREILDWEPTKNLENVIEDSILYFKNFAL